MDQLFVVYLHKFFKKFVWLFNIYIKAEHLLKLECCAKKVSQVIGTVLICYTYTIKFLISILVKCTFIGTKIIINSGAMQANASNVIN